MIFISIEQFIRYVLLGLVQGITEPLPISSSGHLIIFKNIFGVSMDNEINFNIIVNFGSLLAILFYYRLFLKDIIVGAWTYLFKKNKEGYPDFIYCVLIIVATIPAGIAGLLLKDIIDARFSTLLSVGICLFITGMLLIFIQTIAKRANTNKITLKSSLLMGCAQIIGLLPGISRSGVTTSFGVVNKVELDKALRFSFMMYIPISIASMVLGIYDLNINIIYIPGFIAAFFMSMIGTYFAIKFFFKLVKKDNFKYFGYYCLLVSISVLIYLAINK
jgi:undecaprenyl-diphosphatase